MINKLLYMIGLVFIILLVYTPLVAQNNNQRSFSELQKELTYYTNVVNNHGWWFVPNNNEIPLAFPRKDAINVEIQTQINRGTYMEWRLDDMIRMMQDFSNSTKYHMRNTYIPQLKEQIRLHPDNPNNRLNPYNPNIDPYTPEPEPSAATSCHSRGKGDFRIGTGRLQYRCRYYGSGQLHQEIPYVNNKRQGTEMIYYENGSLSGKNDYWDDYVTILRSFDKNGKLLCKKFDRGKYLGRCN